MKLAAVDPDVCGEWKIAGEAFTALGSCTTLTRFTNLIGLIL